MNLDERHSIRGVLRSVKALGWQPATVIDVGVAMGTEGLYDVWPSATICLIEPAEENSPYLRQIEEKYPHVIALCVGASDRVGSASSRVELDYGYAKVRKPHGRLRAGVRGLKRGVGRVLGRAAPPPGPSEGAVVERTVPVTTLDRVVEEHRLEPPFVVKIDTDSHEREILAGGRACLARAELCIIEAAKFAGPERIGFRELVDRMADAGLVFYDFAGCSYGADPDVRPLRQIDLVFAREDGEVARLTAARSSKGDKSQVRVAQRAAALRDNPYI